MKWIWIILGGLAAVVALVAMVGAMLPVKHVASRRARFRQSPEVVWVAVSGPQDWNPNNDRSIRFEVAESDPPRRMVNKIANTDLAFGGSWTYEIERLPDGAELRITENGEVYNAIFRFVSRFIMGHTRTIENTLRALAKKFGENVRIEE